MKNLLYIMLCSALFFVACENVETPTPVDTSKSKLTLTSESIMEYEAEGGHATITYTLENPVAGFKVKANGDSDWLTDFNVSDTKITFYVEANTSEEPREGMVIVSYDKHSFVVGIKQEKYISSEVTITDCVLNGSFNGRDSMAGTIFNYTLLFSDKGMTSGDDSTTSSYSYRINLYSENIHGFIEDSMPNGEFVFDVRGRGNKNSFVPDGSGYTIYNGEETTSYKFVDGNITINDEGLTAVLYTEDGRIHNIIYTGSKSLSYLNAGEPAPLSTLDSDLIFELDSAHIRCYYYGDDYGVGYDNWSISFIEDLASFSGMYLMFNILVDKSKGYTEGAYFGEYQAYTAERNGDYTNVFIPGTWNSFASYSWYVQCQEGFIDWSQSSAPIVGGVIRFTEDDNGVTIEFDCSDDNGHKIKGKVHNHSIGEIYDVRDPKNPQYGF